MPRNSSRLIQANKGGCRGARALPGARRRGMADLPPYGSYGRPAPRPRFPRARTGLLVFALSLQMALLGVAPALAAPAKRPGAPAVARPAAVAKPAPELARIRFWTAPDHTRLVFDFSASPGEPRFRMSDSLTFEVYVPG